MHYLQLITLENLATTYNVLWEPTFSLGYSLGWERARLALQTENIVQKITQLK